MTLQCSLKSLDTSFFEGEVDRIHLPALNGDLTILPQHTPLITFLRSGFLRFVLPETKQILAFSFSSGFASITPDRVRILVRDATVFEEEAEPPFPEQPLVFDEER